MAIPAVAIVVGILASTGGLSLGALIRQPEINRLKAEVRKLQEELEHMGHLVDSTLKDIEILQLRIQLEHNQDLLDELKGKGGADIGKLIYAYGLKEYLEVKVKYLILEEGISEKEAVFADSFSMFLNNNLPDGEDGLTQKRYIKGYLMEKFGKEIEEVIVPDLDTLLNQIKEKVDEKAKQASTSHAEAERQDFIPELECFSLTAEQARFLYSLELLKIEYDIKTAKNDTEKNAKTTWKNQWKTMLLRGLGKESESSFFFIRDAEALYSQMRAAYDKSPKKTWYYLVALEATLFTPYFPMDADKKSNKIWKGLKLNKDYMTEEYVHNQKVVDKAMLDKMIRTYNKNVNKLTGKTLKIVVTVLVTTVVTVATGGLASYFAPGIAVSLVGGSLAGLSGQALVNASLAFIGGGALAAGGLGMAGGVAIITGGGALLGMVGGGATSVTAMVLLSTEGYALRECAKLLTFSSTVLIDEFSMHSTVGLIQQTIEKRISEFGGQLAVLKAKPKTDKKAIKAISENMKYLEKTNKELLAMTVPQK